MEAFKEHLGLAAPLNRLNVDTDQIIPKQFLKRIERTGFGQFLFYDWRFLDNGDPNPDFVLNDHSLSRSEYSGCWGELWLRQFTGTCTVGVATVWVQGGYRAFICRHLSEQLLQKWPPTHRAAGRCDRRSDRTDRRAQEGYRLMIDLEAQQVVQPDGTTRIPFEIGDFEKHCLLNGLAEIGWTLQFDEQISAYEGRIGD